MHALMLLLTIFFFLLLYAINEWLFRSLEYAPGINLIYLPAGARLLCVLLFAETGAVGLLIVSWLINFLVLFPDEPMRAFAGGIVAAAAPYLANLADRRLFGLRPSLGNLSSRRLLACVLFYSIASPVLHHVWFALHGDPLSLRGLAAMSVGDCLGALIVVYCGRLILRIHAALPRRSR